MAKCDQGYLCVICGEEVEHIENSGLYLRYISYCNISSVNYLCGGVVLVI
jgi:hypothetical protein